MIDLGACWRIRLPWLAASVLVTISVSVSASGQAGHEHHRPSAPVETTALGSMSIPNTVLADQDGREVRFYSDLIEDRVVVVNFIFTTCTTICPPMGANFAKLQKLLGERVGRDVEMISVSVDPAVDTPARLNAWARKFGREEGWTLVTGDKPDVDKLLKALKVFTPDKNDHSPILLVGNDARGEWTRAYGLAPPAKLARMLDELIEPAVGATVSGIDDR